MAGILEERRVDSEGLEEQAVGGEGGTHSHRKGVCGRGYVSPQNKN